MNEIFCLIDKKTGDSFIIRGFLSYSLSPTYGISFDYPDGSCKSFRFEFYEFLVPYDSLLVDKAESLDSLIDIIKDYL